LLFTDKLQSPFLFHLALLIRLNVSAKISLRECSDSDSSSDWFKGQKWRIVRECYTFPRQYLNKHEIQVVDAIYDFAQSFMHDSCSFQDLDFVGKPEDLYLCCYSGGSKKVAEYYCPFNITCDCDAGIRVSETKLKILLEATGAHDKRSHLLCTTHTGCCARGVQGVGGFKSDLNDKSSDSSDDKGGFPSFDSRVCTHVRMRRR
jgi:hypothetical protein